MAEPASHDVRVERVNVLGVGISVLNMDLAREAIVQALERKLRGYICITGVHGVMEAQRNLEVKKIHNRAFLCTPDGMPMVWMGHWKGFKQMRRVYGPDLMLEILQVSPARGYRHFFYGSTGGTVQELKRRMETRFPGLQVVGVYEPPFRPLNADEEKDLVSRVTESRPDVFWVGISTPKQEKFMAEYLPKLAVTLMVGVGAAFDMHCGRLRQAPRWMQESGLEWFFRLCMEPRRLWRRYLTNNPRFVWALFCQLCRLKRYDLE